MAKAGRPRIELNPDEIRKLAALNCTIKEIANFFNVSTDTISDNYSSAVEAGREDGKISVRRMLMDHGRKGNTVALKYLIHNVLKERLDPEINVKDILKQLSQMSEKELEEYKQKQLAAYSESKANS
ncbi:unnamed protein product [Sphagnum jensenii]